MKALEALLREDASSGGSAINSADAAGCTALIYAASSGNASAAAALLVARADPGATTRKGQSALALAEEWGHPEVARVLRGDAAV
mmetsp:Transcript_66211/g.205009  ORF Transcript_66211/g.205009 Transcript_66211/m.205009 type:complete len:85 (-) Transcript_66211:116-370(-)